MTERDFIEKVPFPAKPFKIDCGDLPEVREWLDDNDCRWPNGAHPGERSLDSKFLHVDKDGTIRKNSNDKTGREYFLFQSTTPYFNLLAVAKKLSGTSDGFLIQHQPQGSILEDGIDQSNQYQRLIKTLNGAYDQAANRKGKERHAQGLPFEDQPMLSISRILSSNTGLAYQAIKKIQESQRMDTDAAIRELYGAIIYVAGMIIFLEGEVTNDSKSNHD